MLRKKVADVLAKQPTWSCSGMNAKYGACLAKMAKTDMLLDACGHYWCPEHRHRGELLNWAAHHDYPGIVFRGKMIYAIGLAGHEDNKPLWVSAVLMGTDDMINAAIAYIDSEEKAS